ncbi:hypothetical protein SAMN05421676_11168 [Salinibacillus kushneri]|uniref:Lipoprotein n=1 Tax=Salinibacillus kushneri TaxID=237682 RepID=A0A1I0I9S3_9BACI|nr:hypothetical protein [Salinibacillus kushneri]SET93421.1 hypothetical protein SAMN05421676_11168 [Salinibacillus kushneri]
MKRWVLFMSMMLIFIGCSENEENQELDVTDNKENTEQTEEAKALPETLSIPVMTKENSVTIHLENAPLLGHYLSTAKDDVNEIGQTFRAQLLTEETDDALYMMSYACQGEESICSYLLVEKGKEEESVIPLTDLASFVSYQLSPDQEKIMLYFERVINGKKKHHIQVVDLYEHKILSLNNEDLTEQVLDYNYSIESMEWVDTNKIKIRVPSSIHFDEKKKNTDNLGDDFILFEVS